MIKRRDFLKAAGALTLLPLSAFPAVDGSYVITEPCVGVKDTACLNVCPVNAIYGKNEDWESLFIHPEECIDCGLCVDACPVNAIYPIDEVPEKWKSWIAKNYEHFGLKPPE